MAQFRSKINFYISHTLKTQIQKNEKDISFHPGYHAFF